MGRLGCRLALLSRQGLRRLGARHMACNSLIYSRKLQYIRVRNETRVSCLIIVLRHYFYHFDRNSARLADPPECEAKWAKTRFGCGFALLRWKMHSRFPRKICPYRSQGPWTVTSEKTLSHGGDMLAPSGVQSIEPWWWRINYDRSTTCAIACLTPLCSRIWIKKVPFGMFLVPRGK